MSSRFQVVFLIPLFIAIISFILFHVALFQGWFGEDIGVGAVFCEVSDGLVRQPVNTYSNLGFITAGLLIAWQQAAGRFQRRDNPWFRDDFMSVFYASLAVLLGPGSMAMHATMSSLGGTFDLLSMYLIASFIFSYAFYRLMGWRQWGFVGTFVFSMIVMLIGHHIEYKFPFVGFAGSFFFGLFLLVAAALELIHHRFRRKTVKFKFALASLLTMIAAITIWKLSQTGNIWCVPDSMIQGHGVWHLLCALALYLMYRFYVSEGELLPGK